MYNSPSNLTIVHLNELLLSVQVGTWDWDLLTGKVIYSDAWAKILGYELEDLEQSVKTWEHMVLPADLVYANNQIEKHLSGELPIYEAEFRMVCKDGNIIWAQDKGHITEYSQDGKPSRFMGVLQNVTRIKNAELSLLENQETLDLAVSVAGLGTWDWDILNNTIRYNDEYLHMLGYSQDDMNGSIEEWESTNHPEDLIKSSQLLIDYISGKIPTYECEIRMQHKDGSYIWTKDVGKVVARNEKGEPTRLIGGHLNIDETKATEKRLKEALSALEYNNMYLEDEVENRTRELVAHDKMLETVNQVSRKLLSFAHGEDFDALVEDCLRLLGETTNKNRVYIWKDHTSEDGKSYCMQIYEWLRDDISAQPNTKIQEIPYDSLPSFNSAIIEDRCLNSLVSDLSASEKEILSHHGVQTILIAPVAINGRYWGFIGVDNCDNTELFTSIEENMLLMSGSMLANTIEKIETEAKFREVEERTQLMLDATPLCCNLWTPEFQNMNCNDEAARLFDLPSKDEYLRRFHELSPEFQPCGRRSSELAIEYLKKTFAEGYYVFQWIHQKLDGTKIPAEITLVRVKYKDGFIVAGYTRDLREFNKMLAELQSKENDLRLARDEALLSSKAKSNFLANMSHEIRTPMNAISGLAEIITRNTTDNKTSEYARGIKNACNNLLNIINDILDISKIESGKLEIFNTQYELASLLNDVITISRMRLSNKPLMFITDIDSRLPAQLFGDEIRIKQILINMLSNAIKFTQKGYISLSVSGEIQGNNIILRFSIKDSGAGIKDEDLTRLFAEFERVNTTKNRSIEGTGLGLPISKQLTEMMNGTIEVRSVYGEGSEFIVSIPQEFSPCEQLAQINGNKTVLLYEPRQLYRNSISASLSNLQCTCISCLNQSDLYDNINSDVYDYVLTAAIHLEKVQNLLKKNKLSIPIAVFANFNENVSSPDVYTILFPVNCMQLANFLNGYTDDGFPMHNVSNLNFIAPSAHILVVDDNPVNLRVAEGLMAPYQFKIDTAENGAEAVEMVQNTCYDLVFMDHMMPEMDGIDATIAIRQLDGAYYKNLPIIALTANAIVGTREIFIREGMNDFLAKPIEINKLGHVLSKWLPQSKVIKSAPKSSTKLNDEAPAITINGIDTVKGILSVGGSTKNYLQIISTYYTDSNLKCKTLMKHITEKNISAFRTEIHALKSTSATIGASELSTLAANLERAAEHNDTHFIDTNIDNFLLALQDILAAILPVLPPDVKASITSERKPTGDMAELKLLAEKLYDASDIANISEVERLMNTIEAFSWNMDITTELQAIRKYLSVFDYDGIMDSALKLKAII